MSKGKPAFQVGVGNSAEDALVSLVTNCTPANRKALSQRRQIFGKLSKLSFIANLSRLSEVGTHLRATTPYIRIGFQRTTPASSGSFDLNRTTTRISQQT